MHTMLRRCRGRGAGLGGFRRFQAVFRGGHLLSVVVGVFADSMGYQTGCAVGFSGVLFAMKLVLNHGAHAPGSRIRDDFREILTGKTMQNCYRCAW